ncbi:MAG: iron-sulfur cluster assembly accessory protein [Burkholderiales bacterium]|nr:iron-sulfur cluster assembly accessory protein [Burkholderiales bacterium]
MKGPYPFRLTSAAAAQIRRAAQGENAGLDFRVAAKHGTAGALVYGMGFDVPRENDATAESEGVTVLVAPPSQALLVGASLDFVEVAPGEFQFVFRHPEVPETAPG